MAGGAPASWRIQRLEATPAELHALGLPQGPTNRAVRLCRPTCRALVLGSTQPEGAVDWGRAAAAGLEVVRRRSGGGAVLVEPGRQVWVEVMLPAGDRLWERDVARAFWWVGQAWLTALAQLGIAARVHRGSPVRTRWSSTVCFAGLGPGEVILGDAELTKVVGLAQRRTRGGALFSGAALLAWDPRPLLDVLWLADDERDHARRELAHVAAGLDVEAAELEEAFLAALPG